MLIMSSPLAEGIIYDFVEVFVGSVRSNLAAAFVSRGWRVCRLELCTHVDLLVLSARWLVVAARFCSSGGAPRDD